MFLLKLLLLLLLLLRNVKLSGSPTTSVIEKKVMNSVKKNKKRALALELAPQHLNLNSLSTRVHVTYTLTLPAPCKGYHFFALSEMPLPSQHSLTHFS